MSKVLEHKGYFGSIEYSVDDECLYGKLLFIADTVTYESDTVSGLKQEFQEAVEDYIETCKEIGKEPDKPFKGSFNVRVTPELHRKAVISAVKEGTTLNDLVGKAIEEYVEKPTLPIQINHHHHYGSTDTSISTYEDEFEGIGEETKWHSISPSILLH